MGVLVYTLFVYLYGGVLRLLALGGGKARQFREGRLGLMEAVSADMAGEPRRRIWIHAASLGEYEQALPLMEGIKRSFPDYALVLSFFSPSGKEHAATSSLADYVYYLPLDYPGAARRFLDALRPDLGIFVKYELWYHYIEEMRRRGIPLWLISAYFRPDQIFFRFYGGFFRRMLRGFHRIFVQDQRSRSLLAQIGIEEVEVAGDTRFDRVLALSRRPLDLPAALLGFLDHPRVLVAGSTWPEDEAFLEELFFQLDDDWRFLLAPHQWNARRLRRLESRFRGQAQRCSRLSAPDEVLRGRVLILDAIGYLSRAYSQASLAFIGGGWGRVGVHNVLEAAVWGVPLAHGPRYDQYREARELVECGGSWVVVQPEDLAGKLGGGASLSPVLEVRGERAAEYVRSQSGATEKILDSLSLLLSDKE